jgi:UDP-N-acetylglucosamine diphosphorylase/glucosamine-1-phosphate N-acetyltransferase
MLFDIFLLNDKVLRADFQRLTTSRKRREVSDTVTIIGDKSQLFIDAEAGDVEGCIINVAKGSVYIGPGAEVMEGVCMRGPIAICEHATINMGAKIYGATTIGPWSKVGGEVNNTVIFGYSNKAHDGFLGNAVIGEWCNIGAGCVASNLKNDYTEIKLWNYPVHRFLRTGLQFCGLIMGDHSKAGINTMLNTATVLGVGVNIHGSGFPRPFLASFSEGSTAGFNDVPMRKFFETAHKVMARRNIELSDIDIDILNHVREIAEQYR